VLNGAFMFFTDLVKQVNIDCEIDFIRAKSYSDQQQTEVVITKDIETDIAGKNVYLID
jgi:hypoxanthine phosphoribosyltransferase